ncbi:hypothetical protein [Providencia huaxiensis]|uniref:Uncharacterized protein n=1 Tax=Providencia huaxiensis TaxID=2027290 RepID=A0A8I2AE07_9GAMM|nr:hypothetical protein [Providencia huaxiensis]MBQ0268579.1 hypothetical protein [Providencia huaxiensis]
MKRILAVSAVVVCALAIGGGVFVNLAPDSKVQNEVIANYCAEMTRSLMKSPSSYKLTSYQINQYAPTEDEISEQLKIYKSLRDKDNAIWAVIVAYERYSAKNPMGVELVGAAQCEFMRVELGTSSMYSAHKLTINGKSIDGIDFILADTEAEKKLGKLSKDITFMQKLIYRINSLNK